MHYDGRNRAWGGFSPQGARPTAARCRSWSATSRAPGWRNMAPAASLQETHNPDWKPTPAAGDPRADKHGLARSAVGGAHRRPRRRRGLRSHGADQRRQAAHRHHAPARSASSPPRPSGIPGAQGDVLVCEIYTKRVAGEFYDAPKEAETERERPMRIWLAPLDQTADPLSRQARGPDRLRHDPRPAAVLPRAAAHPAGKPGDAEAGCRR